MEEINWSASIVRYDNLNELSDPIIRQLCISAEEAMTDAYAVYSRYHVGSAVLMSNGTIIKGSNQENAVYPLGLCAERVAIFSANTQQPQSSIEVIAVSTKKTTGSGDMPAFPCGSCRQVIIEQELRYGKSIPLYVMDTEHQIYYIKSVRDILPYSFDQRFLSK